MKLRYLFLALLFAGLISSCSDDDGDEDMMEMVEEFDYAVTIMSPDANDKTVGDEIHIHINFDEADLKTVHNISVEIRNIADDSMVYTHEEHAHAESGHFEHHADVVLDVIGDSDLILEAKVWPHSTDDGGEHGHEDEGEHGHDDDHHGLVKASVEFHVDPS